MSTKRIVTVLLILLLISTASLATTYYVDPNGSDNANGLSWPTAFKTIQKGINTAINDDTIDVNEGIYYENINFKGKAITLRSLDPNDPNVIAATIINGNNSGTVVTFNSGETGNAVLSGFTITGGYATNSGGIYCYNHSSPTIRNCVITNNQATNVGGGIYANFYSVPNISNCVITNNTAVYGGGIYCGGTYGTITINNNIISNNHASNDGGGVGVGSYGNFVLRNCLITGNSAANGGGMSRTAYCSAQAINCTVADNTATTNGGGCYGYTTYGAVTIKNSIFWGNDAGSSGDQLSGSNLFVTYSDIEGGWSGTGNINADPLFVNNYHIDVNSPCIDIGDSGGTYIGQVDIDGDNRVIDIPGKGDGIVDVDMGADEYNP
jgi:hypothetical protein